MKSFLEWVNENYGDQFIIMKSSRAYDNPTPLNAYRNPETCACAGVEPGRIYEDEGSAQQDADKLTKCNPVGFTVVKLGPTR